MKHDAIKTVICHHALSLFQKVFRLLPVGRFFSTFHLGFNYYRLNEFKAFLKSQRIRFVKKITHQYLINLENQGSAPKIIRLHPSIRETYNFRGVSEVFLSLCHAWHTRQGERQSFRSEAEKTLSVSTASSTINL